MLVTLHKNKNAQIVLGLLFGIAFGFLLQKGGVTDYNVIIGRNLLRFYRPEINAFCSDCRDDRVPPAETLRTRSVACG